MKNQIVTALALLTFAASSVAMAQAESRMKTSCTAVCLVKSWPDRLSLGMGEEIQFRGSTWIAFNMLKVNLVDSPSVAFLKMKEECQGKAARADAKSAFDFPKLVQSLSISKSAGEFELVDYQPALAAESSCVRSENSLDVRRIPDFVTPSSFRLSSVYEAPQLGRLKHLQVREAAKRAVPQAHLGPSVADALK